MIAGQNSEYFRRKFLHQARRRRNVKNFWRHRWIGAFHLRPSFVANRRTRKTSKQDEDRRSLCGLRNTSEAISRLPGHVKLGSILGEFFRKTLWENSLCSGTVHEEKQNASRKELEDLVVPIRQKLSKILLCTHSGPVNNNECDTDIRAELLRIWATFGRDPGVGVCDWLTQGAYVGISADPKGIDGNLLSRGH